MEPAYLVHLLMRMAEVEVELEQPVVVQLTEEVVVLVVLVEIKVEDKVAQV